MSEPTKISGNMMLALNEITQGFRDKLPKSAQALTDEAFCEGVLQIVAAGFATITVTWHEKGFDAELKLADNFYG